ncbi:MAG: CAP domain-containing protein [Proteobacteria bacterium]|nr:CAP domain-containing protein [Pseudomonadota bacterium]
MLRFVLALAAIGPLLAGCTGPEPVRQTETPAFYASLASPDAKVDAASARDLFNGYRRNLGLSGLAIDPALMAFAEREAQALARADRVDATRERSLPSRLSGAGIAGGSALENVSAGYHTLSDAFSGWRGSPRHDATLRSATARRFGIATAYNPRSKYKIYWVLVTAAP